MNQATAEVAVGALDYLLRRMQDTRDFPALSETIGTLNRLSASSDKSNEQLVAFYLPEEDAAIQDVLRDGKTTALQAQQRVLGVDLDQLGIAVGRHWNLPKVITRSMQPLPQGRPEKPGSQEELIRQLACFADEATKGIADGDRPGDMGELLGRLADCVGLSGRAFADVVQTARSEYRLLAEGLASPKGAPGVLRALAGFAPPDKPAKPSDADIGDIALPQDAGDPDNAAVSDPEPVLIEGLQEVTAMLAEGADLNQVAQVMLETLYRAFGLRRVALCLRDAARKEFVGRLGFGADVDVYLQALRFGEAYDKDVFHVALRQKTDVHIADLAVGGAGHGIPPWYSALSPSGSMLFLPLVVQERVIGFVIAEHARCNGLHLQAGTLRLVRALRNQLALGLQLRRAGRG